MPARRAAVAVTEPAARKACLVCGSAICYEITAAASERWRAQARLRGRHFADPARFGGPGVDPGTVCQTMRRPIAPGHPAGGPSTPSDPVAVGGSDRHSHPGSGEK